MDDRFGRQVKSERFGEFFGGVRMMAPLIAAVIPIGMVFGAAAVAKGLSLAETGLMSALVFAGGSQFVAIDLWTHPASWSALAFAALLVNIRHVLMSASLAGRLDAFGPGRKVLAMLFLADEIWAMAEFRAREQRLTPAFYAGLVAPFYCAWVFSAFAGGLIGSLIGDPAVIGLDFAFPAVFIVLVIGFWKGRSTAAVLLASAAMATLVHQLLPGVWYIAAGAVAGLVAASFTERQEGAR
ncbi:MAG: hypothetical protein RLZZ444_2286 [Pseudomonadota bacterium]|jgi:4-azaleucine resistance transporter AzlC